MPVIAPAVGYGTAIAVELAAGVEKCRRRRHPAAAALSGRLRAGGLAAHVEAVCKATNLGVIVYNRDNAMLDDGHHGAALRALPEPRRLQGRRRRHRTDDARLARWATG